jgi:hypothetical protein
VDSISKHRESGEVSIDRESFCFRKLALEKADPSICFAECDVGRKDQHNAWFGLAELEHFKLKCSRARKSVALYHRLTAAATVLVKML